MFVIQYPILDFHFQTIKQKTWLICTSWHQLGVRCYVNLKIQKFRLEKILYIWLVFLENVFCKSTYRYPANILIAVLQNWRTEFVKILGGVMEKYWEMIARCSVKLPRIVRQKHWKMFRKYAERLFWKTTKNVFAKILKCPLGKILQKYMVFKNIERCLAKILKSFLQKY